LRWHFTFKKAGGKPFCNAICFPFKLFVEFTLKYFPSFNFWLARFHFPFLEFPSFQLYKAMSANVPGVETVAILELSTFPVLR
jgi:hypothetical protein